MSTRNSDRRAELLEQAIRSRRAETGAGIPDLPLRPAGHTRVLGELQHSVWLTHRLQPNSAVYNLASAFRVFGTLDASRLHRAFNAVVARHRILRSTFSLQDDLVLQTVHDHAPLGVERLEVAEGEGLAIAVREAREPFDLGKGPLIRLLWLVENTRGECVLLLLLHHLLADERSLALLWRELGEAYEGRLDRPEPRLQYDDFVYWQGLQDDAARKASLEAIRQRLDPLPEELNLPFEKPPDRNASPQGRLLLRSLDASIQTGIRRLAAATRASPFMVFCFAFRLLLQRYTAGRPFAMATPVTVRSHPATAEMVGYFLNPVILNAPVDEEPSIAQSLRHFCQSLRQSLAHAAVPFHELAKGLSPLRRTGRHPIFQAMFVHQESATPPSLDGLRCEPITLDLGVSKFDLTLFVSEADSSLETALEYRVDRYEEGSMRRLLDHYTVLLENLSVDPTRPTVQVPMLTSTELERLERHSTGAAPDAASMDLLPRQIVAEARASPASTALVWGGIRHSYSELETSAESIASELLIGGLKVGDRVGVFIERSTALIDAILACHLAGGAYVPLDPAYPAARNRSILEDAEVRAVLTTSALRDRVPEGGWTTVAVDLLAMAHPEPTSPPDIGPETPAYLLYTSGSTGRPKGVVVTHGNLRASTEARLQVYDTPPRRFLLLPSIAFDSSVAGIFWILGTGGTLVLPTDEQAREARDLCRLVQEERVTGLLCVPSLFAQLLRTDIDSLRRLETVIVAGESCPSQLVAEHFRSLPQTRLYNEYGPTEATVWATVHEVMPDDATRPVAIGRPIPGVRIDVLDEYGRLVPPGIPGSAWICGPTVAQGYWRRPDLTAAHFAADPSPEATNRSYRTGDRMQWTDDGRLLFLGREDEQLKIRGFRIEPGDIEAALLECPGIRRAAVVARTLVPGSAAGQGTLPTVLVAFAEVAEGESPIDWRQRIADRLPDHMIPSRLVPLVAMPRLPNGKIDRQRLQDLELEAESTSDQQTGILETRAQILIALWEGLLARAGIGLDDNFFELGGHSLLVVELTLAIERDLGVHMTATDVFENPTVRQLLDLMDRRGQVTTPPFEHLYPIQTLGHRSPLIVAIPHFFTEMFAQRFRGERPVYGLRGIGLRAEGNLGRWRTMRQLGEDLLEEIQRRFADTPCVLAGYSFGATMAIETARLMEERGAPARHLILIAPMPLDTFRLGPLRIQLDALQRSPEELSRAEALGHYVRSNNPLTRRPYQRAWRRLAIEPWRRLLCGIGKLRRRLGRPLTSRILWADVRVDRFRLHANYQPHPIHTPTVIFNAEDTATDAAATWRPFFEGPYTVYPTPDPHRNEDSVAVARQIILDHLDDLGD